MSEIDIQENGRTGGATPPREVHLPFDILHELLDFGASFVDLVNLCSTCKALRIHIKNDSLWRRACLPYGLKDVTHFGGRSAYTVYTQLLVPYAPLLGLWANDWPFHGRVLEFRLFAGSEVEQGGIIGELWTFSPQSPPDSPTPPSYTPVLKLGFEDEDIPPHDPPDAVLQDTNAIKILCIADQPNSRHRVSLVRLSETPLGKFVQYYRRRVNLPEFPPHISPWHDTGCRLPHITEVPETTDHHRELIKIYPAARLPAVFVAPTTVMKPPAISILCDIPRTQCELHRSRDHPASMEWFVDNLDGIWFGSYGPSGTECIYLTHDEERGTVEATKITGDLHVPRGCVSWIVHLPLDNQMPALGAYWTSVRSDGLMPHRLLVGHGTIAGRGFTDMAIVELMAGIVSADQIDIFWVELHEFRSYKRYKGRP